MIEAVGGGAIGSADGVAVSVMCCSRAPWGYCYVRASGAVLQSGEAPTFSMGAFGGGLKIRIKGIIAMVISVIQLKTST